MTSKKELLYNYEAFGFDLFWTLVELKEKIVKWKLKDFCDRKEISLKEVADIWKITDNTLIEIFEILGVDLYPEDKKELEEIEKLALKEVENVELKPYSKKILELLKSSGKKIFLISNLAKPYWEVIDRLGLREYFDVMVLSYEVGVVKPNSEIYKDALEKLRIKKPSIVLFSGDRLKPDVEWPKKVGMDSMIIKELVNILLW